MQNTRHQNHRISWHPFALIALAFLAGCATPKFEDGTRAIAIPCDTDNCGKLPPDTD